MAARVTPWDGQKRGGRKPCGRTSGVAFLSYREAEGTAEAPGEASGGLAGRGDQGSPEGYLRLFGAE